MSEEVTCDYCAGPTEYVSSACIYGKCYGMIYLCRKCQAYVGVHRGTDKPLGRLANYELREWKKKTHRVFDPLWKDGGMSRNQAYSLLAKRLGISKRECHIGMFDIERCKQAVEALRDD